MYGSSRRRPRSLIHPPCQQQLEVFVRRVVKVGSKKEGGDAMLRKGLQKTIGGKRVGRILHSDETDQNMELLSFWRTLTFDRSKGTKYAPWHSKQLF